MADTTSENSQQGSKNFSKVFSRKVNRTRERFLHSLGKADRTQDCEFEENVQLFNNQQNAAQKLQKEIKNYVNCLKAMQHASINIFNAIKETYEPNWAGYTEIVNAIEQLSFLWEDYVKRLQTEVQDPLSIYMSRFPDVRARIAKRGRKLVDYDSLRHKLQALENAKKRDEAKINKATEDLQEAEMIYQSMNDEMRYELPQMYESRINFLASNFASFFNVEGKFEEESHKIKRDMSDICEKLQRAHHKGDHGILASNTPVKLPINLRNGGLDDSASAVDLSRNQLSAENSPAPNRNSYAAESPSISGTSTPVPKPRESVHHYTNEPVEPPPNKDSESTNGKRESTQSDDQSYEVVNVRGGKLSGTHTTESRDDDDLTDHAHTPTSLRGYHEQYADEVEYANDPAKDVNEPVKDANENEDKDESDDIYRVPSSNEPLHDNVPFGSNVLYKTAHNQGNTAPSNQTQSTPLATDTHSSLCTPPHQFTGQSSDCDTTDMKSSNVPDTPQNVPVKGSVQKDALSPTYIAMDSSKLGANSHHGISDNTEVDVNYTVNNSNTDTIPPPVPSRSVTPSTRDAEKEVQDILSNAQDEVSITQPPVAWQQPKESGGDKGDKDKSKSHVKPKRKSVPPPIGKISKSKSHSQSHEEHKFVTDFPLSAPPTTLRFEDINENFHSDPFHGEDPFKHDPFVSQECSTSPASDFKDAAFPPESSFADPFQNSTTPLNDPFSPQQSSAFATDVNSNMNAFADDFSSVFVPSTTDNPDDNKPALINAPQGFGNSDPANHPSGVNDDFMFGNDRKSPTNSVDVFGRMLSVSGEPYDNKIQQKFVNNSQTNSKMEPSPVPVNNESFKASVNGTNAAVVDMNLNGQPPLSYGLSNSMLDLSGTSPEIRKSDKSKKSVSMHDLLADLDPFSVVQPTPSHEKHAQFEHFLSSPNENRSSTGYGVSATRENAQTIVDNSLSECFQTGIQHNNMGQIVSDNSPVHDMVVQSTDVIVVQGNNNKNRCVAGAGVNSHEIQDGGGEMRNKDGGLVADENAMIVTRVDEPNILYRVQATHMYTGEDTDELTFEPGEVICVVPWEDPEEQDEGWLHGIKEGTGERGVFPANFTKRL